MTKLKITAVFMMMFAIAFHTTASAEGELEIKPGVYSIVSITQTNLAAGAKANTVERCIQQNDIGTDTVMPDPETCQARNIEKSGNTIKFEMTCIQPDGKSLLNGTGEYSTADDAFTFKHNIKGDYNGTYIEIKSEGNAKRIGDCQSIAPKK